MSRASQTVEALERKQKETKGKPFVVSPELKTAVENYLIAKAYVKTIRPVVEAYKNKILAENVFYESEEHADRAGGIPKRITSDKESWLMNDADSWRYWDLVHEQHLARGFDVPIPNDSTCPLARAEHDVTKAARIIVDKAEYVSGITWDILPFKMFETYTDLTVKLVLGACPDITGRYILDKMIRIKR